MLLVVSYYRIHGSLKKALNSSIVGTSLTIAKMVPILDGTWVEGSAGRHPWLLSFGKSLVISGTFITCADYLAAIHID